jgi:release factor glutamine methyltransferase
MPEKLKTVRELIQVTAAYFGEKGIASPRLEAERLLGDVLGLARIDLYLQHDRPVTAAELDRYRDYVRRRAAGVPLQTLIGLTEFYSRSFRVEPGVFIPRPETEILVEECVRLLTPSDSRLVAPLALEVGTGSGVIAVSLAAEVPALEVWATDVNAAAVRLAERNARRLGVATRVHALEGDLFAPLPARLAGRFDLLVSNPPYVRRDDIAGLPVEVAEHDPREALDGGRDGLTFYRALAAGLDRWLRADGLVAVEIGADQDDAVTEIFRRTGCRDVQVVRDLNDLPRVVTARREAARDVVTESPAGAQGE